jgi:DNA-binding transcriptional LysR family regulator
VDAGPSFPASELDIRSLRYFVAVAEELNFTRAASRLFVAQQAISREIRRLEVRLETPLFQRTTRRVTLTPEGERLLVRARELLALHDQIVVELGASSRPIVVDLMSEGRLTGPRILELTRALAPDREFRGRYGSGVGAALGRLQSGEIDVALGRADWLGQRPQPHLERVLVRWEPLAVLLPASHPLAVAEVVPVEALHGAEIDANLDSPEAPEWSDLARQFLALAGARPTPPHLPAIGLDNQADHLVRQGLPILTGLDHVDVPGGVIRKIVQPTPLYAWSIVWRRGMDSRAVAAVNGAGDQLAAAHRWLKRPDDAWLPEPEASRTAADLVGDPHAPLPE